MKTRFFIALLATVFFAFGAFADSDGGGGVQKKFYTVSKDESGRWWFVAPDGSRFISKGVTSVNFTSYVIRDTNRSDYGEAAIKKHKTKTAWRESVARVLLENNFNTLGGWSEFDVLDTASARDAARAGRPLAWTHSLGLGSKFIARTAGKFDAPQLAAAWRANAAFPDVFEPEFAAAALAAAQKECAARADDPRVLGWFSDNELRWGPDWRNKDELLVSFINAPRPAAGRAAALALLKKRHEKIGNFNRVWKTDLASWDALADAAPGAIATPFPRKSVYMQNADVERELNSGDPLRARFFADCDAFLADAAELYFRAVSAAIHAAAPRQLNLGCRFAYVPYPPVLEAAARHSDVLSLNCYTHDPRQPLARYAEFGRPLLIGEFSFRGDDAGLPNTKGAGPRVKTQRERGEAFAKYVRAAMSNANIVGYHWFQYADQPLEGRAPDGENSNYGLVNGRDESYVEFLRHARAANAQADATHTGGQVSRPSPPPFSHFPVPPPAPPSPGLWPLATA
ncbi:MAG: hypothetical protein LBK99_03545 [Opitutaceae bacterium]|nr:hypothetical protein [Opitutaceae bacterium]